MKKIFGVLTIILLSLNCLANSENSSLNIECRNNYEIAINRKFDSLFSHIADFNGTVEFFGGDKGTAVVTTAFLGFGYPFLMPIDAFGFLDRIDTSYIYKRVLRVVDTGDRNAALDLASRYDREASYSQRSRMADNLIKMIYGKDVTADICKIEGGLALSNVGLEYIAPFATVNEFMHSMAAQDTLGRARGLFDNPSNFIYKQALYPISNVEVMDLLRSVGSSR